MVFPSPARGDSSSKLFAIKNNGSLTLNDSKGTGTVNSTYPVQLYSNATFIMNGGTITSSHGAALDIYTSAVNVKVEINGGSVTVAQGNSDNVFGIRGKENVKVDIKGGDILGAGSNRLAMYVSGDKDGAIELNINGGSVQHTARPSRHTAALSSMYPVMLLSALRRTLPSPHRAATASWS